MVVNSFWRNLGVLILLVLASGCAPEAQPTNAPTLTLIPSTATATPTPIPPTATLQSLTSPQDLLMTVAPTRTALTAEEQTLVEIDPVAAELIGVAQRALGQQLNLPTRRIVLNEIQAVTWPDSSLGCPQPGAQYQQALANGYRIVLTAGQNTYIYHTDFDRVFLCDAENEVLPASFQAAESTVEATLEVAHEATEEATPEAE